ncbi:MAG: hypothetical protein RJB13_1214, partial [Pseudomonadota bacterium]
LVAEIIEAYSPAYGFGSSSAIQAAFHLFFQSLVSTKKTQFAELDSEFWKGVYHTLKLLQGRGSGYDVATQIFGALLDHFEEPLLVSFKDQGRISESGNGMFSPQVSGLSISCDELKKFGCFIETGIQSDTRSVLNNNRTRDLGGYFFDSQKNFADAFIADPQHATAVELCRASSQLALQYGLLPETPELIRFTNVCTALKYPWKTMGAGFGDCLWVMASREEVSEILRDSASSDLNIRFAFEDV